MKMSLTGLNSLACCSKPQPGILHRALAAAGGMQFGVWRDTSVQGCPGEHSFCLRSKAQLTPEGSLGLPASCCSVSTDSSKT